MSPSNQDWIDDLPSGWALTRLDHVLVERKELNKNREETNILSVTNDRGVINYADKGNIGNKASEDIERYKKVRKGDIVANSMNVIIGSVGIAPNDGTLSPVYIVMQPVKNVDVRYYDYIFKTLEFQAQLKRVGYGILAHRMRIPWDNMKVQVLPKPDYETQERIANYLDEETALIDDLIAKQQRLLTLLEEKRRATITRAVTNDSWPRQKIKYIATKRDQKVEAAKDVPYIGLEHVESFSGRRINAEAQSEPEGLTLGYKAGDVLFGKLRPYLAKVLLTSDNGVCSSEFIVLEATNRLLPEFLKYSLLDEQFIELINSSTYGAKMPRANWDFIGNATLALPPLDKQKQIIDHIEQQEKLTDQLKQRIMKQIDLLKERRTSLISSAVTGKVKV